MPAPWPSSGFSPKASIATRQKSWRPAPESGRSAARAGRGTGRRSWRTGPRRGRRPRSRRRSRATARRARGVSAASGCARARPPGRSAGPRASRSAQAGEERQRQAPSRRAGSAAPSTPWSMVAWAARLSARLSCACTASTAGSAPMAPIASVASSQSRSCERASRQPAATASAEQAAARVGEVEGQQHRGHRRDRRASAAPSSSSARLIQSSSATRDPAHRPVRVPVAERVAQARAAAQRVADFDHMGQEAAAEGEKSDKRDGNREAFSETLAPFVGLGDEESGKEEAEVDEDAVRLDHAQLHRSRPEG